MLLTVPILDWALVKRLEKWKHEEEAVVNCQRERGDNGKKAHFDYQLGMDDGLMVKLRGVRNGILV